MSELYQVLSKTGQRCLDGGCRLSPCWQLGLLVLVVLWGVDEML